MAEAAQAAAPYVSRRDGPLGLASCCHVRLSAFQVELPVFLPEPASAPALHVPVPAPVHDSLIFNFHQFLAE